MGCCDGKGSIGILRTVTEGLRSAPRVARQVAMGKYVPYKVKEARMNICEGCPMFQPHQKRCLECTCFLDIKTMLGEERCPIGKW
jgi:hypothetical protein